MNFKYLMSFMLLLVFPFCSFGQCPGGGTLTNSELVLNGDFTLGDTGFTSEYTYSDADLLLEAYYSVTDNALNVHDQFSGNDHTTGSGNFMVVNGAADPNTNVWCQRIKVQPHTTYVFSTWVTSVFYWGPALLQFSINGKNLDTTFNAPNVVGKWEQFYTTWDSGDDTIAQICIVNQNTDVFGNDFGLDDISFMACGCGANAYAGKDTTLCKGSIIQLNGKGGKNYNWFPSTALSNDTIPNPVATPTETTTYMLVAKNASCSDTDEITITVVDKPDAVVSKSDTLCRGETTQLQASGGTTYFWQPATGLSATNIPTPVANPTTTTTYTVQVSNGICTDTASVTVVRLNAATDPKPTVYTICRGESKQLSVSGGKKYKWLPASALSNDTIPDPITFTDKSIEYKAVVYTDKCADTVIFSIIVNDLPAVKIFADTPFCIGQTLQLKAEGAETYLWQNGSTTNYNSVSISEPTAIWVVGKTNQCIATDTLRINPKKCEPDLSCLWVPNSFTPNGDERNDNFEYVHCNLKKIELYIYNRWGEELYYTDKIGHFWNGTFKGEIVQEGVYIYIIHAQGDDGQFYYPNGTVTLLR